MEEEKKCDFYYGDGTDQCPRAADFSDGKCVFHSSDPAKLSGDKWKDALASKELGELEGIVFLERLTFDAVPNNWKRGISGERLLEKDLIFKNVEFRAGFDLSNITFTMGIKMDGCVMREGCSLGGSTFKEGLALSECSLQGTLSLEEIVVKQGAYVRISKVTAVTDEGVEHPPSIEFTGVKTNVPGAITFEEMDLSRCRLLRTDVENINFSRCEWHNQARCEKGRAKTERTLCDEIVGQWDYTPCRTCVSKQQKSLEADKSAILDLYRGLRRNFEVKLQYPEAGDFHIGEMEVRRLTIWDDRSRSLMSRVAEYFVTSMYRALSVYGERYIRPGFILTCVIFVSAILYLFTGLQGSEMLMTGQGQFIMKQTLIDYKQLLPSSLVNVITDFLCAFYYSFSVATLFIKDKHYVFVPGWGQAVFLLESLAGAVLIPLFILALRRRFKR